MLIDPAMAQLYQCITVDFLRVPPGMTFDDI